MNTRKAGRVGPNKWKQRLFAAGYLTAVVIAMIGGSVGLGWAALSVVKLAVSLNQ